MALAPRVAFDAAAEATLVRRLAAFEADAWETLFERDFQRLYRFARVRTGDDGAAEDIAAEVFEEAARRIGSFEFRGLSVSAWLFRVARNLIADHLDRRRRRPAVPLDDTELEGTPRATDIENLADVTRAILGLTREQQEVVALRFVTGCDLQETASAMGKSVGAVKVLQHRALTAIKKKVGVGEGELVQR
jgi:RNA polymerase sigma-70 factor (ECF subfamily)